MISCEEYQSLHELLQAQLLWLDGIRLMSRKTNKLNVELFTLYDFYAEIFFDKENEDPLYIKAFDNTNYLDVYLDKINIDKAFVRYWKCFLMPGYNQIQKQNSKILFFLAL